MTPYEVEFNTKQALTIVLHNMIKRQRCKEVDLRKKAQEVKEQKLISLTITNTDNVMEMCINMQNCTGCRRFDNSRNDKLEILQSKKIKYYKSVNRGLVKGSLFLVTSGGQALTSEELAGRLKEIIQQIEHP